MSPGAPEVLVVSHDRRGSMTTRLRYFGFLVFALSLGTALLALEPPAGKLRENLRNYLVEKFATDVEVVSLCRVRPGVFAARYDTQADWFGSFVVFQTDASGTIRFTYDVSPLPDEQSVFSVRVRRLKGFETPLIFVMGRTHMGNGCLYVYQLYPGQAICLMKARVFARLGDLCFDRHPARLTIADVNQDGIDDIEITATLIEHSTGARHSYRRLFQGFRSGFSENRSAARGLPWVAPYGL